MTDEKQSHGSLVLHVIVIGFHHKKGCQVEYSYPPLIEGNPVDSNQVPDEWKHLPSLGIPDGAHNYTKDTIFFHLPSRVEKHETVYGVACYRQIDAKDLVHKSSDVTRSTVQKSVCVLSRLPLFGLIQTKLELITHAYFDEKDFSQVKLLEDTYKNLTISLTDSMKEGSNMLLGMSARDVVQEFKHKIVLLFKLILLERRVLFCGTPVAKLCNALLSVLSLFPGMIEYGLQEAATCNGQRLLSPTLHATRYNSNDSDEYLEIHYHDDKPVLTTNSPEAHPHNKSPVNRSLSTEPESPSMDRDCEVDKDSETSTVGSDYVKVESKFKDNCDKTADQSLSELCDKTNEKDCDKPKSSIQNKENQDISGESPLNFIHGISIGNHNFEETKLTSCEKTASIDKSSPETQPKTPSSADSTLSDPFTDMKSFTQLEAIQTGETIHNNSSVINIEELAEKCEDFDENDKPTTLELSLNLEDLKRSVSVEDIDSPESIQNIDKEDCFSWEQDSLLLAIDPHLDSSGDHTDSIRGIKSAEVAKDSSEKEGSSQDTPTQPVEQAASKPGDTNGKGSTENSKEGSPTKSEEKDSPGKRAAALKNRLSSAFGGLNVKEKIINRKSNNNNKMIPMQDLKNSIPIVPKLQQDDFGFPLMTFTKGYICHPYLSLQYYDLLNDVNVRGFVIGATNFLFRQKRHLTDVVIEVSEGKIEFNDRELQKLLNLTTADLRFADIIVKAVIGDDEDSPFETTEWEGGDEWLRAQFRLYLQSLLVTCSQEDTKLQEDFGLPFVQAFKTTHSYRVWAGDSHTGMADVAVGHPCHGNLGMNDIRVRLAHSMQSTERGKKINAAVSQTGKYVVQTGKVVGGAITQARSAVSSWFSNFTQDWKKEEKEKPES